LDPPFDAMCIGLVHLFVRKLDLFAAGKVELLKEQELQKLLTEDASKLEPVLEENGESIEKASSGRALRDSESVEPRVRRVTIVDYYTSDAGDLSTSVGMSGAFC